MPASGLAQDPFGGGADPLGDAGAATPLDTGDASATTTTQPKDDGETDPIVLAIRNSNPTTVIELADAIRNVVNLGRPDEAKKYIQKLLDGSPDANTLVELHRALGSAIFMKMSREESFAPEGPALGKAVLDAAYAAAHRSGIHCRTDRKTKRRGRRHSPHGIGRSARRRHRCRCRFDRRIGGWQSQHRTLRNPGDLVNLKELSVGPLVGALETRDEALLPQVIVVLSRLNASQVTPHLLRPYFTSKPDASSVGLPNTA